MQGLLIAAGLCGLFVIVSEIPFWGSRSGLWPVLTALGIAVVALAVAQFVAWRERRGPTPQQGNSAESQRVLEKDQWRGS